MIVVRSNRPDFPVGRTLPDDAQLQLGNGETVTILGAAGSRVFRGPGRFSPAAPVRAGARSRDPAASNRVGGITMSSLERGRPAYRWRRRRAMGGAIGGVVGSLVGYGRAVTEPAIWDVAVAQGGTICLRPAGADSFWRGDARAEQTLTVTGPDGAAHTLTWPAGQRLLAWPADLAAADGAEYALQLSGAAAASRIRVALLAADPAEPRDAAASFIEKGCQHQLDRLIEATLEPEPAPAL